MSTFPCLVMILGRMQSISRTYGIRRHMASARTTRKVGKISPMKGKETDLMLKQLEDSTDLVRRIALAFLRWRRTWTDY